MWYRAGAPPSTPQPSASREKHLSYQDVETPDSFQLFLNRQQELQAIICGLEVDAITPFESFGVPANKAGGHSIHASCVESRN